MSVEKDQQNERAIRLSEEISDATKAIFDANDDGPGMWALARAFFGLGGASLLEAVAAVPNLSPAERRIFSSSALLFELFAILSAHRGAIDEEWPGERVENLDAAIAAISAASDALGPTLSVMAADAGSKPN